MWTCGPVILAALSSSASVIVWGLVLLAVLVVVAIGVEVARRRWWTPGRESAGSGFSMDRLEALHRGGQISDKEFERLRRQVLGLPAAGNPLASVSSPPPPGDDGNAGKPR